VQQAGCSKKQFCSKFSIQPKTCYRCFPFLSTVRARNAFLIALIEVRGRSVLARLSSLFE
jgi:hypothetical protein